jgi:hypothetical protein
MASISLKNVPDDLHINIKRLQLEYQSQGKKLSLEDLYIELIRLGLNNKTDNSK